MTIPHHHSQYSASEELANALTHGIAAAAALGAGAVLITLSALWGDVWQLSGAIVYVATLFVMYLASTVYHSIPQPKLKARFKVLDHCAIYLLIAGTYTPFMLVGLRGPWGWSLLTVIWSLAAAGIAFKLFFTGRFKLISTLIYIAMGWLIVVAVKPMMNSLSAFTLQWLLAGGLFYTLGTVFYMAKKIPYSHSIWHGFVIAGSASHFVAVMSHVAVRQAASGA
ncbi:PAQR family membrane homeostasis protein TrhA [Aquilutibacter rugosus]|uniref:PAQR family membrane homeostasis protein TrhA n=1 Tax=Aquilutibacter rugosus TaxID=3115820 RepID=UPI002F40D1A5